VAAKIAVAIVLAMWPVLRTPMATRPRICLARLLARTVALSGVPACGCITKRHKPAPDADLGQSSPMSPQRQLVERGGVLVCTWRYMGTVPAKEVRIRKGQLLRR
jgi:hypothetical protein